MNTKPLRKALEPCAALCAHRSPIPCTSQIHVEAKRGILTLRACDSTVFAERHIDFSGDIPACLVNAAKLNLFACSSDELDIQPKGDHLLLSGNGSLKLPTAEAGGYVAWVEAKLERIELNCALLADMVDSVKFATQPKFLDRIWQACVCVDATKGVLRTLGFEGHMFAVREESSPSQTACILVHGDYATQFANELREPNAELLHSDNLISVKNANGQTWWPKPNCSSTEFPIQFIDQLKTGFADVVKCDREALLDAVMFARMVGKDERNSTTDLHWTAEGIVVKTTGYERTLPGVCRPCMSQCNPDYIHVILQNLGGKEVAVSRQDDTVALRMQSETMTCVLKELRIIK